METRDMDIVRDVTLTLLEFLKKEEEQETFTCYCLRSVHGNESSCKSKFGSDSLAGKKVLVQGIGHVGETLVDYLTKEGAIVTIADINEENCMK
jgi:leucine dehydrogenase